MTVSFANQTGGSGGQDKSDVIIETLKTIDHACAKQAQVIVEMCSFAGTSNVLNVQSMLHYCNDPVDKEKGDDDLYQAFAVMGIALVAMGEDVGAEMALRTFSNLVGVHTHLKHECTHHLV
jgi:26S proteasome regulatory subunit N1